MKINDLTSESRDMYDKIKYNILLVSRFNKIKKDLLIGGNLEILCEEYFTINQILIGYNIKNDPELEKLKNEVLQSLLSAGGSSYLNEEVNFYQPVVY